MSEDAQGAPEHPDGIQAPGSLARTASLTEIRLAAGFLTILPVLPRAGITPEALAASFGWFPLVGFAIGAVLAAENLLLTPCFGDALARGAAGAHAQHTDRRGSSRCARRYRRRVGRRDQSPARAGDHARQPDRQFRHGRDLFLSRARDRRARDDERSAAHAALWLAPGLARWAMVAVAWRIDYLRAEGAGTLLLEPAAMRNLALATAHRRDRDAARALVARADGVCRRRGACGRAARGVPAMARRRDGRSYRCGGRTGRTRGAAGDGGYLTRSG